MFQGARYSIERERQRLLIEVSETVLYSWVDGNLTWSIQHWEHCADRSRELSQARELKASDHFWSVNECVVEDSKIVVLDTIGRHKVDCIAEWPDQEVSPAEMFEEPDCAVSEIVMPLAHFARKDGPLHEALEGRYEALPSDRRPEFAVAAMDRLLKITGEEGKRPTLPTASCTRLEPDGRDFRWMVVRDSRLRLWNDGVRRAG